MCSFYLCYNCLLCLSATWDVIFTHHWPNRAIRGLKIKIFVRHFSFNFIHFNCRFLHFMMMLTQVTLFYDARWEAIVKKCESQNIWTISMWFSFFSTRIFCWGWHYLNTNCSHFALWYGRRDVTPAWCKFQLISDEILSYWG